MLYGLESVVPSEIIGAALQPIAAQDRSYRDRVRRKMTRPL